MNLRSPDRWFKCPSAPSQRHRSARGSVGPIGLMLIAIFLAAGVPRARAAGPPTLRVEVPQQVAEGQAIAVTLALDNAVDLGGYEATIRFDTAAAEFAGLDQRGSGLKGPGRDTGALSVAEMPGGAALGMYS